MTVRMPPDAPLTLEQIRAMQELEAKATPAPWYAATTPHPAAERNKTEAASVYGPGCRIYTAARDYSTLPETFARQCADADLIAALRNAAPQLLAALDRLAHVEQENAELVEFVSCVLEERQLPNGQYPHHLLCNGDRHQPAGTIGVTCNCLPSVRRDRHDLAALRVERDRLIWTVDNIYTVARREAKRPQEKLRPEMWGHVIRLCEKVGANERTVGVLRDAAPAAQRQE